MGHGFGLFPANFSFRARGGKFAASNVGCPNCEALRYVVQGQKEPVRVRRTLLHDFCTAARVSRDAPIVGSKTILTTSQRNILAGLSAIASTAFMAGPAFAQDAPEYITRGPIANGYGFQEYATDIMREVVWFNAYTLWFLVPIGILVGGLIGYVIWRYNSNRHPVASRTAHNTTIEVVWTVAPVLVLLFLAVPSFQLLTAQFDPPKEAELTVKTTGYQWYWGYEYQSEKDGSPVLTFDSLPLLQDKDRDAFGKTDLAMYPNLLAVDNEFVVPIGKVVRLLVTGGDVIHSWAMPSFGKKMDAIPGRLNETWFKVDEPGLYYGQCSELCGKDHAFMPIAVRAVPVDLFNEWYAAAVENLDQANRDLIAAVSSMPETQQPTTPGMTTSETSSVAPEVIEDASGAEPTRTALATNQATAPVAN